MLYINDRGRLVDMVCRVYLIKPIVSTYDKCNVCGWTGLSDDVIENECPVCGSEDMDDIDGNPYED